MSRYAMKRKRESLKMLYRIPSQQNNETNNNPLQLQTLCEESCGLISGGEVILNKGFSLHGHYSKIKL